MLQHTSGITDSFLVKELAGERTNRRDEPAFISKLQRGPEGTHAAMEAPGRSAVISHPVF